MTLNIEFFGDHFGFPVLHNFEGKIVFKKLNMFDFPIV